MLFSGLAFADSGCEKRIRDTGMIAAQTDPKTICDRKPNRLTQDCLVDLLTKLKGKLRKSDLYEVYGVCHADPLQDVRDCMVRTMAKEWNDPAYVSARAAGDKCLRARKNLAKRLKTIRQLNSSGTGASPAGTKGTTTRSK